MSYINIEHFNKTIKKNTILDDINLSLSKGMIYGFVGINGSGKTMLFRAISGLISATSGSITIDGIKIGNGVHPKNVGLIIENADLWGNLSSFENLNILNTMSDNTISKKEIKELISEFGLDPESKKSYNAFSLGMKQKLRLAQAFMGNPELLILDEPTNALDEKSIEKLRILIAQQKESGTTILLASHSSEDIHMLCDKIIYMENGKITKIEEVNSK